MAGELIAPEIIIRKSDRALEIRDDGRLIETFKFVLGSDPLGTKSVEGDGRTPEGEFYVCAKNPESKFHLSLGLSYPSREDAVRGLRTGIIDQSEHDAIVAAIDEKRLPPQETALGGKIYIHGGGIEEDWTEGCVALKNEDIERVFEAIALGSKVTILS